MRIASLYGDLVALTGSPIVELNRAVAVSMADGPAAGLAVTNGLLDVVVLRPDQDCCRQPGASRPIGGRACVMSEVVAHLVDEASAQQLAADANRLQLFDACRRLHH